MYRDYITKGTGLGIEKSANIACLVRFACFLARIANLMHFLFGRELMEAFPDAKVILTVRNPKSWYNSVLNTIYYGFVNGQSLAMRIFSAISPKAKFIEVTHKVCCVAPQGFDTGTIWTHSPREKNIGCINCLILFLGLFPSVARGQEAAEEFFERWNEEVRSHVPPERLLEFEVKEGWDPLVKFLDVPHPGKDVPFPRLNDTRSLRANISRFFVIAHLVVYGIPIAVSVLLYSLFGSS